MQIETEITFPQRLWPCEGRRPQSDPAGGAFRLTLRRRTSLYCASMHNPMRLVYTQSKQKQRVPFHSDFGPAKAVGRSQTRPVERGKGPSISILKFAIVSSSLGYQIKPQYSGIPLYQDPSSPHRIPCLLGIMDGDARI